jgi:hypothetical protein
MHLIRKEKLLIFFTIKAQDPSQIRIQFRNIIYSKNIEFR